MKLYPVNHAKGDTNRFCGPSAISAITGMSTGEAARLLRHVSGKTSIKGTSTWSVIKALKLCGVDARSRLLRVTDLPTLAQWLRDTKRGKSIWLVVAGHHFQLVQGVRFVCGITKDVVGLTHPKVRRRSRVAEVYELTLAPGITRTAIPVEARKPKIVARKVLTERALAIRLAARIGVEIERHTDMDSRPWFVSHPDLQDEKDPCEGDHYCYNWAEVLDKVCAYEKHLHG